MAFVASKQVRRTLWGHTPSCEPSHPPTPKPSPARTRYVLIEIDDISPNRLASIEEVEIQNAAPGIDKS